MKGMSEYGRSDKRESFAEAFVEWHLTKGSTTSEAVSYFRKKYDWDAEGGVPVAKAVSKSVTIVADTFVAGEPPIIRENVILPNLVDWTLEQSVGKAVVVRFEPGLRPVLKHGSHDQRAHGNWSRGGLDAGIADAILADVKAQGGLSVSMIDGSKPTTGYMVAIGGATGSIASADDFFDPQKGPKILGDYFKEHKATLSGGNYLGLWHNTGDGKVYLDLSQNVKSKSEATRLGRQRDQISIWDVVREEEIDTGGTGKVGKAVEDGGVAGSVGDDGSGDRRVRKEGVADVRGAVFVGFGPGIRPVLKHGTHDQSSHGSWATGRVDVQSGYRGLNATTAMAVTKAAESHGLTIRSVEAEFDRRIEMARTMDDPYQPGKTAYEGGLDWYETAGGTATQIGGGNLEQGAGMVSALSPQNPWTSNVKAAEMVADMRDRRTDLGLDTPEKAWEYYKANHSEFGKGSKGGCGPVTEPDFRQAWEIANGASPGEVLTGRKRQNFYNNIIGDPNSVTVDVHMMKALSTSDGSTLVGKKAAAAFWQQSWDTTKSAEKKGIEPRKVKGTGYTFAAQAVINIARRTGLQPRQVQAIIWNTCVTERWAQPSKGDVSDG
jgi:hypothetical protein